MNRILTVLLTTTTIAGTCYAESGPAATIEYGALGQPQVMLHSTTVRGGYQFERPMGASDSAYAFVRPELGARAFFLEDAVGLTPLIGIAGGIGGRWAQADLHVREAVYIDANGVALMTELGTSLDFKIGPVGIGPNAGAVLLYAGWTALDIGAHASVSF